MIQEPENNIQYSKHSVQFCVLGGIQICFGLNQGEWFNFGAILRDNYQLTHTVTCIIRRVVQIELIKGILIGLLFTFV